MRYLYSIFLYLASPYIFLRLLWRSRDNPAYRQRWSERLGFCPHKLDKCIWVHAASLGETIGATPLIKALKAKYPHLPIVVTNMTITGGVRTKAAFGDSVLQAYIPYDFPDAAARFLDRINPVIAIIIETELWPNLFHACEKRHIPIFVANARLSAKSAAGYRRVAPVTRRMLKSIQMIAAQTKVEADRFISLGLPADRVVVTGSIKFDVEVPSDLAAKSEALRKQLGEKRLIWIAASTHATEDEIVLSAYKKVLEKIPNALLILVPRHPERFDAVNALVEQQGFQVARRSKQAPCTEATQVYLGDTMGELLLMYAVSDVAFIGGSFVPVGGHNILEASVVGKPVITGPQLFNFAEISEKLIAANGMFVVQNGDELAAEVTQLFQDTYYRNKIGENGHAFVGDNRGALAKHMAAIQINE